MTFLRDFLLYRDEYFSEEKTVNEDELLSRKDQIKEFMLHLLDQSGATEHGSSVGGSWLSEKGKYLLKELRK